MQHLEVRRGGKHGHQFEKVSPAEPLFAFLTHRQPDTIETNLFRCDEVFENCLAFTPLHLPKNRQASNAGLRILAREPAMLEAERENLLGKKVERLTRRNDRLHKALLPQRDQGRGMQQGSRIRCQKKAIPCRAFTPSGSSESLEKRSNRGRCIDLDYPV